MVRMHTDKKNCGEDAVRQKKGQKKGIKKIVVRTHLDKKKRDKKKNCGEDVVRKKNSCRKRLV